MNPLLEAFLVEAREFLQGIGEKLLALEQSPQDEAQLNELFRLVHTLKGNSGLFDFPEMTRVLHAAEDLMDAVRAHRRAFDSGVADALLAAMDFVAALLDAIESRGRYELADAQAGEAIAAQLRGLVATEAIGAEVPGDQGDGGAPPAASPELAAPSSTVTAAQEDAVSLGGEDAAVPVRDAALVGTEALRAFLAAIPEEKRREALRAAADAPSWWLRYTPAPDSFYKGEDPFYQARHTPGLIWGRAVGGPWPPLQELDCYQSALTYEMLVVASLEELREYYRYVPEEIALEPVPPVALMQVGPVPHVEPVLQDFVVAARSQLAAGVLDALRASAEALLELLAADGWAAAMLRWLLAWLDAAPKETRAIARLLDTLASGDALQWRPEDFIEPLRWLGQAPLATAVTAPGKAEPESLTNVDPSPTATPLSDTRAAPAADSVRPPLGEEERAFAARILAAQQEIWQLRDAPAWWPGRLKASVATLAALCDHLGLARDGLDEALHAALAQRSAAPVAAWVDARRGAFDAALQDSPPVEPASAVATQPSATPSQAAVLASTPIGSSDSRAAVACAPGAAGATSPRSSMLSDTAARPGASPVGHGNQLHAGAAGQRAGASGSGVVEAGPDAPAANRVLKVDQARIDRLMNLIGEMVVAKNALPYLAKRAEEVYGVRELAREIKAQYAVINRIAEEMQDAIMQVRMMPLSFVLQRFPRLVRDLARRLNKEVELVIEGEDTELDKNIVEALADPLIHIVRNSLDHGIETPTERQAAGKPPKGLLSVRARPEGDRAIIEIRDDGRGIDPAKIKRKAYERGLIGEEQLERLSDAEAVQLVFLPGFSTAEQISDVSGRGVGMDVVRSAVEKAGGTVRLASAEGQGTTVTLTLPLSMAVSNVMIIETNAQIFGIPMDQVIETVRLPRAAVRSFKNARTTLLRGRVVPIIALNELLAIATAPRCNDEGEYAVIVVRHHNEPVGLLIDEFREVVDVIIKPLPGELAHLRCYAGSALLGDGSVLLVLEPKALLGQIAYAG